MSERTVEVTKFRNQIRLKTNYGVYLFIPDDEIDAIMEDIKNLR